ncbi:BTAD domain-containing putative transcriptional regulator [Streptomyces sioyaensis]|uniref:BTAD domain-containing putative transcriptional regulator n=1 Tax=Streptomyces sioyaensis TaxID=67364 RepID=UPI003D7428E1
MPHPHSPTRRPWPLALVRIAGSLVALAALVVGLPLALLRIGTLPAGMPSVGDIGDALMAPDDGQILFTAITLVCWVLWAWFIASLVVEAAALLRHRAAPRVRGLAAPQRLAAVLLGGLLVLPSATAIAATPATAVAHGATAAPGPSTAHAPTPQKATHTGPRHTVGATGETVWDLAEHYLGDGRRHAEIRALNPSLPQTATLPAGTIVNLPAEASGVHTPLAAAAPASAEASTRQEAKTETYTVAAGDSLSGIAQKKLGDGDRWTDIYAENKDTIHDPDLIYPGERVDLPQQEVTPAPPAEGSKHDQDAAPQHEQHTPEPDDANNAAPHHEHQQQGTGGEKTQPAPHTPDASDEKSGGQQGHTAAPQHEPADPAEPENAEPTAPHSPTNATPAPHQPAPAADSTPASSGQIAAIGGGVLAAALLSTVATRRILQQRRRHRGRRIALPEDGAAATEQNLRTAEAALDTTMLDGALRTAAVHLTAADRELPPLSAAVIGPREIVLHLTEPAAPVPPFTAAPDALQRWTCSTRGGDLLPQEQTDDVESPYPTLASLGWDQQGHLILLDLENAGHLHLTGADRHRVLRTLALELAASEFADHLTVSAIGPSAPGLREELPERVIEHADVAGARAALRTHHTEQQRALAIMGAPGLRRARTGEETAAAWSPHLLFANADDVAGTELEDLRQVVADYPRSATALVTTGSGAAALPGAQVVDADTSAGPITLLLPGTEVEVSCNVQALSDEDYAYALQVLATTRADDVPAAQPVATPPKAVPDPPQYTTATEEPAAAPVTPRAVAPASPPAQVPSLMAQFAVYEDEPPTDADDQPHAPVGDTESEAADGLPSVDEMDAAATSGSSAAAAQQRGPAVHAHVSILKETPEPLPEPEVAVDSAGDGPVVRMLGPVDIEGARGSIESKRKRTCIELAAWLVLHPNLDHHAVDEAMWPGRDTARKYRNATVSRLRTWLGTDEDGNPFFPPIATTSDARYALAPAVDSDWHHFQRLTAAAATSPGPQAAAQLRAALELVRGRPFSGVNSRRYAWAEHQAQDMISAIVDAAADLAEHCLAQGDPRGALWAATKGLDAAPEMENLYRLQFRTYAALGDWDALERAAEKLDTLNMELGVDMEEATAEILAQLSKSA